MMQPSISQYIRQLRRQRGMTQTDLGGEHFSKSYVSAVEREKIVPSYEALRFFASQLEQPADYFEQITEQSMSLQSTVAHQVGHSLSFQETHDEQDESMALLSMVLEGSELSHASFSQEVLALPLETITDLPPLKQARYCLMKGLIQQKEGHLEEAQPLLERALALSPAKYQPAILDALGTNSALAHAYQTALDYHRRALCLLEGDRENKASPLLLKIELHCGDACRALNLHSKALLHYEHARQTLHPTSNIDIAGQTYMGMGYCTYASIYQESDQTPLSYEEKERQLQRASSFLLQSRTLYQVSSNRLGESQARLLQAMTLLGICWLRRQKTREKIQEATTIPSLQCATILDEAEEQCRQILLSWHEPALDTDPFSSEMEAIIYSALSTLTNVYVQRAAVARLEGYGDTALRDRARATRLCQLILDSLTSPELRRSLIQNALMQESAEMYRVQPLPRLPSIPKDGIPLHPIGLTAVFSASGEVAEELGRTATTSSYAHDCYTQADTCFKASLNTERQVLFTKEHDASYLQRSYQHYIALIEERLLVHPVSADITYQSMLDIFKASLD